MEKNMTTTGEALAASQEVTLVIEQFLNENYRFRRNVLNRKVEFAILPKWDGQNHIARIFGRIPGITSELSDYLAALCCGPLDADGHAARQRVCAIR